MVVMGRLTSALTPANFHHHAFHCIARVVTVDTSRLRRLLLPREPHVGYCEPVVSRNLSHCYVIGTLTHKKVNLNLRQGRFAFCSGSLASFLQTRLGIERLFIRRGSQSAVGSNISFSSRSRRI